MTEIAAEILVMVPLGALALHLWLRARRAEALLADGDRQNRELVAEMMVLAERDPLTGVANRRAFNRALAGIHHRPGATRAGALVLIDLDNFKQVNDRLGHQRGDEVLRDVARAIQRRVRDTDVVARLGGDEFAVVLPGVDSERAQTVADDLRAAIRDACMDLPPRAAIDASVGVASLGSEAQAGDVVELVARADAAMYRVKRAHRSGGRHRRFRSVEDQLQLSSS
jgi:diguanylate cyclase (GGDEF)-like protein